jgi:hypothetical protein
MVAHATGGVWLGLGDAVPGDAQVLWPGVVLYNLMELWTLPPPDVQEVAALFA